MSKPTNKQILEAIGNLEEKVDKGTPHFFTVFLMNRNRWQSLENCMLWLALYVIPIVPARIQKDIFDVSLYELCLFGVVYAWSNFKRMPSRNFA